MAENHGQYDQWVVLDTVEDEIIEERQVNEPQWVMRDGQYNNEHNTYNKTFKLKKTMFVLGQKDHT